MKKKLWLNNLFFVIPFLILITISLLLMYHAGFISNLYANHFSKQLLWFGLGFLLLFLMKFIPIKYFFTYSFWLYLFNVFLLGLVLLIGKEINGAKAWLDFKFFSFQPSEFMKLTYSFYLAHLCSKKKFYSFGDEFKFLFYVLLILAIPSGLVFLEPDTGAICFYLIITIVLLWNSRLHKRWFVIIGALFLFLLGMFFYLFFHHRDFLIAMIGTGIFYRIERIFTLGVGMQIENALIAIGSAPWFKFSLEETGIYIPEAPTDFAFALTSNVLGIMGNILLLLSFLILDIYFVFYVRKIKKKEWQLFFKAFLAIFILSQVINISMNIGLFPIMGIPLPFVSYGGSATIVLFIYLAIIFQCKKKKAKHLKTVRNYVSNSFGKIH